MTLRKIFVSFCSFYGMRLRSLSLQAYNMP
nr:MAG TPA: hypothetical protein [Caudoviricetes sp.]